MKTTPQSSMTITTTTTPPIIISSSSSSDNTTTNTGGEKECEDRQTDQVPISYFFDSNNIHFPLLSL